MPPDIMRSNFPPTPKEATLLRALLKKKEDELSATNEQILNARGAVASAKEAIQKLTKSRESARMTIETYETHAGHLRSSLELLETRFKFVSAVSATESSDPTSCVALSDLLMPDILKRRENAKLEIEGLEQMCVKVKASITDIDEDLRCQHYVDKVNSKSLESYIVIQTMAQSAVDEISGSFRAIKRVPNEIWSNILNMRVIEDTHWLLEVMKFSLFLPALPLSQVCRTWRSVLTSSPSMWRMLYWGVVGASDDDINRNYIDLWWEMVGRERLIVCEAQTNARTSAAQTLGPHLLGRSKDFVYHVIQSKDGIPDNFNANNAPKLSILALGLHAPSSSRHLRVQPELYSQFNSVQQLALADLLPHGGLTLQDSLTSLTITFSRAHRSYKLSRFLLSSLVYLCLQHFKMAETPAVEEVVQLPNIRTLDITPLECKIIEKLEMPKLSSLTLSSPVKVSASPEGWLDSIITLCTTVAHLRIHCPSLLKFKKHRDTMGFDVIQILTKLLPQSPELQRITLLGVIFEGEGLVSVFEEKKNEGVTFRKLKVLTIDNCIGVSRMDCERLVQYVEKLNVYQTVHKHDDVQG